MKSIFFSTGGIHLCTFVGMLCELQNRIDEPEAIGGISAGSMIAAICATYGIDDGIDVMTQHINDKLLKTRHKYFNTVLSILFNESLLDSEKLLRVAENLLVGRTLLSDLYIGYTNKDTMEYVSKKFEKGKVYPDLHLHVVASMSIPLVLPPVQINKENYIDGGVYHSLPVEAIKDVVQQSIERKDPLDLVILMAQPLNYHLNKDSEHVKFFKILKQGMRFMTGYQCVRVHNDNLFINQILQNAKLAGDHINYSLYHLKQEQTEYWDEKVPMSHYADIKSNEIKDLIDLGKSIIIESLKTDLKF